MADKVDINALFGIKPKVEDGKVVQVQAPTPPSQPQTPSAPSAIGGLQAALRGISNNAVTPPSAAPAPAQFIVPEPIVPATSATPIKSFIFDDQAESYPSEVLAEIEQAVLTLTNSIDNKELVGNAVASIVSKIAQHDFLKDILAPEVLGLMVRGLRESYGVAVAKKSKASAKRAATSAGLEKTKSLLSGLSFDL